MPGSNNESCVQRPFKHVAIQGVGLMGIAHSVQHSKQFSNTCLLCNKHLQCCLQSGYKTSLVARTDERAKEARIEIEKFFQKRAGKLFPDDTSKSRQWLDETLSLLHIGTDLKQALIEADIFIEAVIENREIKQSLFAEVERLGQPGIVLVTNTSSMRLIDLGEKLKNPERLGGLHFLSPVPAMKIVEVVRSEKTSGEIIERLDAFGRSLDKVTILCKDSPGFIVNRMVIPLLNISHVLVDENIASLEAIDLASKMGMNLPMGLLSLSDMIGLDTIRNANQEMMKYNGVMNLKQSHTLDRLVAEGHLGRKSGRGFFDYSNKTKD